MTKKSALAAVGVLGIVSCLGISLSAAWPTRPATSPVGDSIPYLASRSDTVRDMLGMASAGKDDILYDLGSGDGRIPIAAVRDFGVRRAVGIENNRQHIQESRHNAAKAAVAEAVRFEEGDLFTSDFSEASVVTLFLGHAPNIRLRPRLIGELKPGSRVVSHQFGMGEWEPDKSLTVRTVLLGMCGTACNPFSSNPRVPDYNANESRCGENDKVFVWVVPAAVAGIWRARIETSQGPRDCRLVLHQCLSHVTGTLDISGQPTVSGSVWADLWGDQLRFTASLQDTNQQFTLRFDGHVSGDTMQGNSELLEAGQTRRSTWEAKREATDLAGTWEWPCASGPRQVRLRIERRDGKLVATYVDRDRSLHIDDFYGFGGGFYFTLLINRDEQGLRINEDTGWLIGEGVMDGDGLKGTIEFHSYQNGSPRPVGGQASRPSNPVQPWTPRRVAP